MITLNLLPPTQCTAIRKERIYLIIENFLSIFLVILIITALILFLAKKTLEKNLKELAIQDVQANIKTSELNKKIQAVNNTLEIIEEIQKKTKNISPFILEFSQTVPEKAKIDSLQINPKDNSVGIKGWASTRSDLLEFKENLEASGKFTKIEIPLSSLLEKENLEFDINCIIN
jgi:Tfp pilus assembly protein PilN